jgi:hypothetical protein
LALIDPKNVGIYQARACQLNSERTDDNNNNASSTTYDADGQIVFIIGFGNVIRPHQLLATLEEDEGSASRSRAAQRSDKPALAAGLTT